MVSSAGGMLTFVFLCDKCVTSAALTRGGLLKGVCVPYKVTEREQTPQSAPPASCWDNAD